MAANEWFTLKKEKDPEILLSSDASDNEWAYVISDLLEKDMAVQQGVFAHFC